MNTKAFKTVSILMIVFGILGVLSGISMLSGTSWTLVTAILNLVNSILLVTAGVIGTKTVKTGEDSMVALCKKLSFVLIAIAVVNIVVSLFANTQIDVPIANASMVMGMTIIGGVVSLILPILYFLGAKKLGE